MGISSYYEVVPSTVLDAIGADEDVALAFDCLWGCGSGMYSWFVELGEPEIVEITEDREVPSRAIQTLRNLLTSSKAYPTAYIEKTHEEHQAMLRSAFASVGAPNPDELARIAVFGEEDWGHGTQMAVISNVRCQQFANLAMQFSVGDVVRSFDLGNRMPEERWRKSLSSELRGLVDCYSLAANEGHQVITGVT